MANFDKFFNNLMQAEGGYANNPLDRGGETLYGVSSKYFPKDVANLKLMSELGQNPEPYLRDFYKREFWDKSGAENVPESMRLAYADTAVNSGIGTAKELLNKSTNVDEFLNNRQDFVSDIVSSDPSQAVFQEGWNNRIEGLRGDVQDDSTRVNAPDGTVIKFPSSMSQEDILAVMREKFPPTQAVEQAQEQTQEINPILRGIGRAGRNIVAAIGGATDVALLAPKTIASGLELGLEASGFEGSPLENFAQSIRTTPTMRDSALGLIDQATNDTLKPQGTTEKVFDFVAEALLPTGFASKAKGGLLKATDAVINPTTLIKRPEKIQRMTAEQMRRASGELYSIADELGGIIKPEAGAKFIRNVMNDLTPQTAEGRLLAGQDEVTDIVQRVKTLAGKPISLRGADEIDKILGDEIDKFVDPVTGKLKSQGVKILKIQGAFRDMIESATEQDIVGTVEGFEALKSARKLWGRSAKLGDVERIIQRATMMDQPANAIRSQFRTLYNNPKRMRGYNKAEREAIKRAAKTGIIGEVLRTSGSRLFGIGSTLTGGAGGAVAGKATEVISRGLGERMALKRADDVARIIAGESPSMLRAVDAPLSAGVAISGSSVLNRIKESK